MAVTQESWLTALVRTSGTIANVWKDRAMSRAPHVVVLLLEPVIGFDATIPPQLFGTARDAGGVPLYQVTTASLDAGPVRSEHGYAMVPEADASVLADADTVVIPGTVGKGPRRHGTIDDDLRAALELVRPGTRMVSICTGAFVLAAAGLLDGRPATTHWDKVADFRALYPQVLLDEDRLFVDDGDVLTSAGLAAGVDLCLHLIRRDHGAEVANHVARYNVVPPWRDGGQAQFIERPVPVLDAESTAPARAWALAHLDGTVDIAGMAAAARMSRRTFIRRFGEETGQSPGAWVSKQRVELALRLLERTDLGVDEVATRAG